MRNGWLTSMMEGAIVLALCAPTAVAEPMDLSDPTPRTVAVRFEVSPPDRPGQTDVAYSPPFSARLEPGDVHGEIRVVIDGGIVERHLLTGQEPVPDSFSDFVWRFDARTGQVGQADVSGRLMRELGWGIQVEVPIRVHMDTSRQAGFEPPRRLLGHQYHGFCGTGAAEGCTAVHPRSYDRSTGYVNAVGDIVVSSGPLRIHSFSPLGEAIFSELPPGIPWRAGAGAPSVHVSAPPPAE
jgi:hypothetical protein